MRTTDKACWLLSERLLPGLPKAQKQLPWNMRSQATVMRTAQEEVSCSSLFEVLATARRVNGTSVMPQQTCPKEAPLQSMNVKPSTTWDKYKYKYRDTDLQCGEHSTSAGFSDCAHCSDVTVYIISRAKLDGEKHTFFIKNQTDGR